MNSKGEKISRLSKCIFVLEAKCGHLKWKVTDLEKKSGVSRSLIYRYMGSTKDKIFKNGFKVFIAEFYGFDPEEKDENFLQRIYQARSLMMEFSDAILFYQKWRMSNAEISNDFHTIETKFQKKLKKLFPEVEENKIPILHGFIHGMVTAPFLSPEQAVEGMVLLNNLNLFGSTKVKFKQC